MPFPMSNTNVSQLYKSVMEDVINNVRETFLDEGVDEQILLELKQIWENKLSQTKAIPAENAHTTAVTTSSATTTNDQVLATQLTLQSHAAQINAQNKGPRAIGTAVTTQSMPVGTMMHPTLQYHYATTTQGSADGSTKTVTITLPQNPGSGQKPMTITLPAQLVQHAAGGIVMSTPAAAAAQALPPNVAASLLQAPLATISTAGVISHPSADGTTISYQAVTAEQLAKHGYMMAPVTTQALTTTTQASGVIQIDGANDTSDDDDEDDDFKDDDNDPDDNDDGNEDENEGPGEDEEPLNTEDDVSDEDPSELFDTDNVIVCQYDKITRSRNKWKFHLKDGIMNLQGRDFVFQKASGDAEW